MSAGRSCSDYNINLIRRCNLFYCDDCTPSRIDLELNESRPAPKCSRLLRVCRKCYTTVCQEKYIPQIIRQFMDKVAPKREMTSSPPIEVVGLKYLNKHSIKIICDLRGHPAVLIPSGYKTSITLTNSRLITTTEVAPFPTFEEPKRSSTVSNHLNTVLNRPGRCQSSVVSISHRVNEARTFSSYRLKHKCGSV